ncbi:mitogen-activated protein kinase [Syncephalastrum racemosum]|uniref:Mitogen-activated protein kinase n=1 Tax=Syncephalastrum racemosum TaxID=13706 RepID=A0A1X2HHS8_SYNRA|nr:mitogen-activated protein kinase [Syncephalastrum racemosum]
MSKHHPCSLFSVNLSLCLSVCRGSANICTHLLFLFLLFMTIAKDFDGLCQPLLSEGLQAALVTDKDGVVMLKNVLPSAPPRFIEPTFLTSFGVASSQASKIGLKQNKCIVSTFDLYQVIQFDHSPIIITLITDAGANTGIFVQLGYTIQDLTRPLAQDLQDKQT